MKHTITLIPGDGIGPECVQATQRINIPSIISKNPVRFDRKGDVRGGTFVIYKITNGKYSPVG